MARLIGDIDIDVFSQTEKQKYGVRAVIYNSENKSISPHPSGFYIDQNMPVDTITGNAAIEYEEADDLGFFKIDLLTNTYYDVFSSKEEVLAALVEPDWSLFTDKSVVKTIPHLHEYHELLELIKPTDIETLADILAIIRPGKMKYVDQYVIDKAKVRTNLYRRGQNGYTFKRSHAIATATQIVAYVNHTRGRTLVSY